MTESVQQKPNRLLQCAEHLIEVTFIGPNQSNKNRIRATKTESVVPIVIYSVGASFDDVGASFEDLWGPLLKNGIGGHF